MIWLIDNMPPCIFATLVVLFLLGMGLGVEAMVAKGNYVLFGVTAAGGVVVMMAMIFFA